MVTESKIYQFKIYITECNKYFKEVINKNKIIYIINCKLK